MTTTLGGTTLANPYACTEREVTPASQRRMADGTLITDTGSSTKLAWDVEWRAITGPITDSGTPSQMYTIWTEVTDNASQVFSPPDRATTYNVMVERGSWDYEMVKVAGGGIRYNARVTLLEV